jgi:hypothetical protein
MRLCRFDDDRLGLVEGDVVYDVTGAIEAVPPFRWPIPMGDALVAHLPEVCSAAQKLKPHARQFELAGIKLRSPVANPSKIMAAPAKYPAMWSIASSALIFLPAFESRRSLFLGACISQRGESNKFR